MEQLKDELEEITQRPLSREDKLSIIAEAKATGKPLGEVASKWSLPYIFVLDDNGNFQHEGRTWTLKEFEKVHPYARVVTITTEENRQKFKNK